MSSYNKHIKVFKTFYEQLKSKKFEDHIKSDITQFMFYLEKNFLLDKNYLKHHALFLSCEVNQEKIKDVSADLLLSFLTMIYRIDYIDANSDAFMIYYKNKMLENILKALIDKILKIIGV